MFDVSTTPLAAVINDNRYKAVLSLYHYCVLVNLFFQCLQSVSCRFHQIFKLNRSRYCVFTTLIEILALFSVVRSVPR